MIDRVRSFAAALLLGLILGVLLASSGAMAARKLALVIGNGAYKGAPILGNPSNDADDLSKALRGAGFEVIERRDADRNAMAEAVRDFSGKLDGVDTALFFYAGHGLQVNGANYLVPVDAKIESAADAHFATIDLNDILSEMEAEKRTNIVILDACRDNPFAAAVAHGGRSLGGRGLSRVDKTSVGTLVVYSTQPDNIALDGRGRNSPFTEALLKYVGTPGLEVRQMMSKVRADVLASTDNKQVPWDNSSLIGDVYLAGQSVPEAATVPAQTQPSRSAPAADTGTAELVFWQSVAKVDTKEMYEGYLRQFGENGQFAFLAHQRLDGLTRQTAALTATAGTERELAPPQTDAPPLTECEKQTAQVRLGTDGNTMMGAVPVLLIQACQAAMAAHPGDPRFEVLLGKAYETMPDYLSANKQFQIAIAQNYAPALVRLGMNYQLGHGLLKNGAKAMELYTKAIEFHDTYSIFLIGTLYEQGIGVPKDYIKARDYYEKSAELGEVKALRSLGILYFNGGEGVTRNYATAVQYLQQAAVLGNKQAMKLIGTIYQTGGWGVARNYAKAREWNAKAVETP